jgi:hypothetical protein
VTGKSADSFKDVDAEVVIGLDDRLIGAVMDEVVAVVSGKNTDRLDVVAARLICVIRLSSGFGTLFTLICKFESS